MYEEVMSQTLAGLSEQEKLELLHSFPTLHIMERSLYRFEKFTKSQKNSCSRVFEGNLTL